MAQQQIAIGYISGSGSEPTMNPSPNNVISLEKGDKLVVLAED